jgi:glycosyltransferase involved in cell wall biosynthesis
MQIRFSRRIRQAAQQASILIAANSSTQSDLERHVAGRLLRELETGIDFPIRSPRALRNPDEPLHILWVGRLRSWKGLPMLLRALARTPREMRYRLRVVGDGKCMSQWQRLAKRLQIDPYVEWLPRPPYRESLQHYEWADVFAFTSLRDTSGAGLLEALAYAVPIIGLHHQGAADIMDAASSVPIPLTNPAQVTADFADALHELATDSELLKSLSDGALRRAREYVWENRQSAIQQLYAPFARGDTVSAIAPMISSKKI